MKNIIILTKLNIKRNYYALLLSVLGAAMLSILLYSLGNLIADMTVAKVNIGVLDYDNSLLSHDFKQYMKEELNYNLLENDSYDDLTTELIDKDISVIIEIPKGLHKTVLTESKPEILITSLEDYENAAFIEAYINSYISSILMLAAGAQGNQKAFDQLLGDYRDVNIIL
ncbi:MAG: type transporter, partial [Herbinix sp.]|nr:type transporter [Herbinix sp.]